MQWVQYEVDGITYDTFCLEADRLFWEAKGKEYRHRQGRWRPGTIPVTPDPSIPAVMKAGVRRAQDVWSQAMRKADEWRDFFGGRALLAPEVSAMFKKRGKNPSQSEWAYVRILVLTGAARVLPGVETNGAALKRRCFRCGAGFGGIRRTRCARCHDVCYYCDRCLMMGRSQACIPLFLFEPLPARPGTPVRAYLPFSLSGAQRVASRRCADWLESGASNTLLLWAVTGAGKTEVLFQTLERALSRHSPVLWVAPRRDVVVEVAERLSRAFPSITTVTLHGESGQTWLDGELFVGTVHQAMRFYHRFSLVVIDEADAYPLQQNEYLQMVVDRARRPEGKRILVTATPPASWKREFQRQSWPIVTLRARHHGYPLPEPRIIRAWGWHRRMIAGKANAPLEAFVEQVSHTEGQALIFVPRLVDGRRLVNWLKVRMRIPEKKVAFASAREEERAQYVERFRQGSLWLLVTTTILERGVTVPHCHVLVAGADHPVFDTASLVQIAGRVGRSAEYRKGQVWFVSRVVTGEMARAKEAIRALNGKAGLRDVTEGAGE